MSGIRSLALALAASLSLAFPAAALAPANDTEISELGQAKSGRIDVFEIQVHNPVCDKPQNFRFVPHNLPWLRLVHGNRVTAVARGQTKTFAAEINLSGLKPGRYSGNLAIICETCGDVPLSLCDIDKRNVVINVEVVAALPPATRLRHS
jgi:hypothetical protein